MAKMKMPKMDVIRFNESDVIVASGDQPVRRSITIAGMDDTTKGNGTYDFGTYHYTTATSYTTIENAIHEYFGTDGDTPLFYTPEGNFYSVNAFNRADNAGQDKDGTSNGTYYYVRSGEFYQ